VIAEKNQEVRSADIQKGVVLNNSLPRKHARPALSACRECDQLLIELRRNRLRQERGFSSSRSEFLPLRDFVLGRTHRRLWFRKVQTRPSFDASRNPMSPGRLRGNARREIAVVWHLKARGASARVRNQFAVVTALREKMFWWSPKNIRSRFHCLEFALQWREPEHGCDGSRRAH